MKGKLITVEGIDGSGKGTQAELLVEALKKAGKKVKMYSFPAYETTFFGGEIGAFLRGEFGTFDDVHPKLASILFASDRLEQKPALIRDLDDGFYVICDRYVESNAAHQSAKFAESERSGFIEWIKTLEYKVNQLPKPDMTFFLDLPIEFSKELVLKKKKRSYTDEKEDIQEAQHGYLEKVYHVYKQLEISESWLKIDCVNEDTLLPIETIHKIILNRVLSEQ
ncbi:dTMP kinase [Alteromonas sp. 5E99-2]|uniref:dTMP kinase n=1 Tax=Alteromonas sp. 5E99-2 TaxID=2817683 RepID=UPI001A99A965|nr:dTMP kinase [Alteromonas sp. 5E99-2]MBO1255816.1 dTMP kinase [Alteromonas sp. 5E99-2]